MQESQEKIGVLLVNLGTPDAPRRADVRRYLSQFLTDRRVIDYPWLPRQLLVRGLIAPLRSGKSAKAYQDLWTDNGSPLRYYGDILAEEVQKLLGNHYKVELAMRYQNPSIESSIDKLLDSGVKQMIVVSLFPQYASATTGSVFEEVFRILSQKEVIPQIKTIQSYPNHPGLIETIVDRAQAFDLGKYDRYVFSYHGLPFRQLAKADKNNHCANDGECCKNWSAINRNCYSAQCAATTDAIIKALDLDRAKCLTVFQSRLGPEEWLKPYAAESLKEMAAKGHKKLLFFSPAFVCDCLETIIEIGEEYKEEWIEMGGQELDLVPSLNDHPRWIKTVVEMIQEV